MSVLFEDVVLENKKRLYCIGEHEVWHIRVKDQHRHKAKWFVVDWVRELYPHLILTS